MFRFVLKLKINDVVSALLCTIVGLILMIWPGISTKVICMVLGGVLLAYGVIQILLYCRASEKTLYRQVLLILGIVFSVIGAWILLSPEDIIKAVPVIIGIIIIVQGLHNVVRAFDLKQLSYEMWWIAFLLGFLSIVLGGILVFNPFKVVNTVMRVIGGFLIYNGISDLWVLSRVHRTKKSADEIIDCEVIDYK